MVHSDIDADTAYAADVAADAVDANAADADVADAVVVTDVAIDVVDAAYAVDADMHLLCSDMGTKLDAWPLHGVFRKSWRKRQFQFR